MAKDNRKNGQGRPKAVEKFMELDWKGFKKEHKGTYSKKEMKQAYIESLMDVLPETVEWVVRLGYRESESSVKEKLYSTIFSEAVLEKLIDYADSSNFKKDFFLLPIIIRDMLMVLTEKQNNPETKDSSFEDGIKQLTTLSEILTKKRVKKLVKKGLDQNMVTDLLSIVPKSDAMKYGTYFRLAEFFKILYAHGAKEDVIIPIDVLFNSVIGEEYTSQIIDFALLERKSKYEEFNDCQKKVFNDITNWIFQKLEESDADIIREILIKYTQKRKKDFEEGKDSPRRFYLESVPESEFPRVAKEVKKLLAKNPEDKKFM